MDVSNDKSWARQRGRAREAAGDGWQGRRAPFSEGRGVTPIPACDPSPS